MKGLSAAFDPDAVADSTVTWFLRSWKFGDRHQEDQNEAQEVSFDKVDEAR
jgi:hypothetical protein